MLATELATMLDVTTSTEDMFEVGLAGDPITEPPELKRGVKIPVKVSGPTGVAAGGVTTPELDSVAGNPSEFGSVSIVVPLSSDTATLGTVDGAAAVITTFDKPEAWVDRGGDSEDRYTNEGVTYDRLRFELSMELD